jgi:RNA polymerase sigma-70 factor (ECF subfamily)
MSDRPTSTIRNRPQALMARLDEEPREAAALRLRIARAAAGDAAAFREIVLCYERRVLTLARRLLGNAHDAEEAAQEAFLRAWRFIHRVDPSRSLEPWLIRLTVNVCRSFASRRGTPRSRFPQLAEDEVAAPASVSPEVELEADERRTLLRKALEDLPPRERAALVLRDLEGYSTSEVASILRSSETTVRSQISRARLRLRKALGPLEPGGSDS